MMKIKAEHELLLCLCKPECTDSAIEEARRHITFIDNWNRFAWLANEHGISALVYYNMKKTGLAELMPDKENYILHSTYLKSLSRNTVLWEKFNALKKELREINITPVPIKGMALERSVYGNKGLRQMNDVDILIERDRCMEAWEYLLTRDYDHHLIKSPRYRKMLPWIGKHLPELYKDGISFEIHHSLFDNVTVDEPSPMQHFLFLVKHLDYHETIQGESQLRLYNDLVMMIHHYGSKILNDELFAMADAYGIEKELNRKLSLIQNFYKIPTDPSLTSLVQVSDLRQSSHSKHQRRISGSTTSGSDPSLTLRMTDAGRRFLSFLANPKHNKPAYTKRKIYRMKIKAIRGSRRKYNFVMGDIFPSAEFMKRRYGLKNRFAILLFYIHRMGKILWLIPV